MKALFYWTLAASAALSGFSRAQSAEKKAASPGSAKESSAMEKLVGAWRLAWMEEPGPDGKVTRITDRKGMLLYTRDGHMSVQIMFPKSESGVSNDYVQGGYEASFGSYEVNEQGRTVTHHVEGSITRGLVGKDLPRVFQFSDGHLIIKSSRPDEHWSVAWEHY
jgi:Lipocalin-like domain